VRVSDAIFIIEGRRVRDRHAGHAEAFDRRLQDAAELLYDGRRRLGSKTAHTHGRLRDQQAAGLADRG
jgi:hypothetical protein